MDLPAKFLALLLGVSVRGVVLFIGLFWDLEEIVEVAVHDLQRVVCGLIVIRVRNILILAHDLLFVVHFSLENG